MLVDTLKDKKDDFVLNYNSVKTKLKCIFVISRNHVEILFMLNRHNNSIQNLDLWAAINLELLQS